MPIHIRGANEYNLKDIDLTIGDGLTVVTGVSGSGKTSLVFDTLYHEARRRFEEIYNLGAAEGRLSPAAVRQMDGLGPAVAVGQNLLNRNPLTTLASAAGLQPFLRLLYARFGQRHCAACGAVLELSSQDEVVEHLFRACETLPDGDRPAQNKSLEVWAPVLRGVAVLVEKPMAMDAVQVYDMLTASAESGSALMVAHNWRFHEEVQWLQEQVHSERLGKVIRTHGTSIHMDWGPSGWFTSKALASGGALADMGVHAIDTARFLLGDPLPKSVFARVGTHYIEADVDDTAELIITWQDDSYSHIEAGWWQPHAGGGEAASGVYGTVGYGSVFPTQMKLRQLGGQVETVLSGYPFPRRSELVQAMYARQMAYFVSCIETGSPPTPGGKEGWVNMQIVDAAYQSAQTGQAVEL